MSETFERIRDTYFLNPTDPDGTELADAAGLVISGVVSPERLNGFDAAEGPVADIARQITAEYQAARVFDHHSVAQLHPADNMVALLAHMASTIRNNNTIIGKVSPLETSYEVSSIGWLLRNIAGYDPDKASGSLVSGGTSANHTALTVARERLQSEGWDGRTPAKLFASSMAHYSVTKSARLLAPRGIIEVDKVPLDPGGLRMDPMALRERVEQARRDGQPIMGIVAVAGETETGLVDDLEAMAEIARDNNVYLHVDGAYGAPYRVSRVGNLFEAVTESNSLTCDPHKYLYVPYASGSIMFADGEEHALLERLNIDGQDYMFKTDEGALRAHADFVNNSTHLGNKRIEGSMGGQAAAALHFTIRHLGREGIAALLDHNLDVAAAFADEMRDHNELGLSFEPELNTVCVEPSAMLRRGRHSNTDARVEALSSALERERGIYLDTTSLPDRRGAASGEGDKVNKYKVLRFVSTHPYTSEEHARQIAKAVKETWEQV